MTVLDRANANVRPDARSGAFFAEAALRAAVFTVRANAPAIDDATFVTTVGRRIDEIEVAAEAALEEIRSSALGE